MKKRQLVPFVVAAAFAAAPAIVFAQAKKEEAPKQAAAGKQQAVNIAQCTGCHGIPGYKTAYPEVYHVPKIAGQQPAYIVNALKAYKSGERAHPSMRGVAASLTEEDMAALAAYYGAPAK